MSLTVNDDLNFLDDDIEDDSEDFDPNALLSEPLMDDDSIEFGLLSSDPSNFEPEPPTFQFNGSSQQKVQGPVQYESFQQPQHQQQQSFNNFIQTKTRHTPHNPLQNGRSGQDTFLPLNDSDSHIQESQQAVTMRMQELQQQIHQVQNQIQHVQYQSSQLELQSSQREDPSNVPQPQNSQGYNVQGMVNNAGMSRNPPDRSVSAPVMPRSGNFSRGFMEAQQQPQAPSLAAMAASLQRGQQTDDSSQSFGKQSAQGQDPGNVSEAMEKLCESMRRSAMSRNMVRQLSGRSAPTSRGMGKSKSGGLVRGNMSRTHSGADALVRPGPIRRLTHDSKHRIQRDALSSSGGPPGRGVFRHKSSQGALAGTTRSQIDDNTRGKF